MSVCHYLKSNHRINYEEMCYELAQEMPFLRGELRSEDLLYLYLDTKSTRGVDLSYENGVYELRNTTLSNEMDIYLTNQIANYLRDKTKGEFYNEDNKIITTKNLIGKKVAKELYISGANTFYILGKSEEIDTGNFCIFGPNRPVYFGKRISNLFQSLEDDEYELARAYEELILKVQYLLPDYDSGNIMSIGKDEEDENMKTMKLISMENNYILQRTDYILLFEDGVENVSQMLIVAYDDFKTILPEEWELVDENTIVAPALGFEKFEKLKIKAKCFKTEI